MGYLISLLLYNFLSPPPFIRENKKEQGEYFWAFFASYFDTTETQIKNIFKKQTYLSRATHEEILLHWW